MYKFGILKNNEDIEFKFDNLYEFDEHADWSRIKIGINKNQIDLITDWAKRHNGEFGVLYVLKLSRLGHEHGRYQNTTPVDIKALSSFLTKFKDYFENDGRHHLWVIDLDSKDQLIYDNHQILYAYGDLNKCRKLLLDNNFKEGSIRIPAPHTHHYNKEYDKLEDEIFDYWEWKRFPLIEEHDNP